jgi:carbon monoxide dehydrogenase subunit G
VQLENSFTVPVPAADAWAVLVDIRQVVPCMPGASLDGVDGDSFTGRVKVKLGPVNLTYRGQASFVEKDPATRRAVIDARGKDQRGNGTAAAVVTATLVEEGENTRVDVLTDLNVTGRPAQFGRGVMAEVSNKLIGQFADRLATRLTAEEPVPPAPAASVAGSAGGGPATGPSTVDASTVDGSAAGRSTAGRSTVEPSRVDGAVAAGAVPPAAEAEAIDLLALTAGRLRRVAVAAAVAVVAAVVGLLVRRRRR